MADYRKMAWNAAVNAGIDPRTFVKQIQAESNFNPRAGSSAGAQGIAQIMPATARGWGVDPWNPNAALNAAAKNMAKYINSYGGWRNALVAYNAGPGRVGKPLYSETANYISKILGGGGEPPAGGPFSLKPGGGAQDSPFALPGAEGGDGSGRKSLALKMLLSDDPVDSWDLFSLKREATPLQNPGASEATPSFGGGGPAPGKGWQALSNWAEGFGLPITSTTGGKHAPGSFHYSGRAVDVGLGKGGQQMAAYARRHPGQFVEFFGPMNWHIKNGRIVQGAFPDHGDHYHVAR